MDKTIQLYPFQTRMHSAYNSLLKNTPNGYKVVTKKASGIEKSSAIKKILPILNKYFKLNRFYKKFKTPTKFQGADIVLSMGKVYEGSGPWILDILDNPFSMSQYNYKDFIKDRKKIEDRLAEQNCKAIICENEESVKIFKNFFNKKVSKKINLIRAGVPHLNRTKTKDNIKTRILFMGSLKNPKDFYVKGGVEAIRAFELVEHRKDCRLILRCKLPKQIFKKIRKNTNIEILQKKVSRKEIEKLYLNSDIFLLPAHTYMLMSTLEAMSFGLPIIGIKSWATSEFIKDGKTGFLIDPQKLRKYYIAPEYPINIKNKFFYNKIKKAEEGVARDIASKINLLLENPSLRRKMGARARKIAQKKFSIKKRTRKLKSLFDKCTNKL